MKGLARTLATSIALSGPRRRPAPGTTGRRKVLAVRPDHLGDLLLTTPALELLRARMPAAHLALLVGPWNETAARHLPWIDEVLVCPFPWFDRQSKRPPWEAYRVLQEAAGALGPAGFTDAVVLRHDFWFGAAVAAGAGIPRRIGYALPAVARYLSDPHPYPGPSHETLQALALVDAGFPGEGPAEPPRGGFVPSGPEQDAAAALVVGLGASGPLVAVHPGSGAAVKAWPTAHFAGVVRWLAQVQGARVVVTGGREEQPLVEAVLEAAGSTALAVVGQPLGVTAAVLQRCDLALGVDSGIMHLAAAVGTATVRLYGPASPERFGPWGEPARHRVVQSDPLCLPCERLDYSREELRLHPCIRSISPSAVLAAAADLLRERVPSD